MRVWYDGTDKARIALLGSLGESDVIKNGADLWTWSSRDNTATHRTLASTAGSHSRSEPLPAQLDGTGAPLSPPDAAAAALRAVDSSTIVSTDSTQTVAGRPVYQLILQPRKTAGSLIDRVAIAVDGATHLPLRVQVFAVDHSAPALEIAFTSVDFGSPDNAQFTFNPPPGAQVSTVTPTADTAGRTPTRVPAAAGALHPTVVGTGWSTVLLASRTNLPVAGQLGAALQLLPAVSGSWGHGHLLAGTLFSVVITDAGKIAIGAVRPSVLYQALAAK